MKRQLSLLALCALLPVCGLAQQATPTPPAKPSPTPRDKRPLLERIFGSYPKVTPFKTQPATPAPSSTPHHKGRHGRSTAEATPSATAAAPGASVTPSPAEDESTSRKYRHRRHRRGTQPAASPEPSASPNAPTPAASAAPAPTPKMKRGRRGSKPAEASPSPSPTPPPAKAEASPPSSPLNVQNPFVPTTGEPGKEAESAIDRDAQERTHYNEIRAKALEDDKVLALKEKMDTASSEEEQAKASKVYYDALYEKMRKLDPALKDRIDRMQAVTSKRLEQTP